MLTNAAARPGDVVVLTKPLGTGVIATALKAGHAPAHAVETATRSMTTLNRDAAAAALRHGVLAATDVTGFGLAGHACAVARQSRVTLEIRGSGLPALPGALDLALGFQPRGLNANRSRFEPQTDYRVEMEEAHRALLFDPQTSGGLLLFLPRAEAAALLEELPAARAIGQVRTPLATPLVIV